MKYSQSSVLSGQIFLLNNNNIHESEAVFETSRCENNAFPFDIAGIGGGGGPENIKKNVCEYKYQISRRILISESLNIKNRKMHRSTLAKVTCAKTAPLVSNSGRRNTRRGERKVALCWCFLSSKSLSNGDIKVCVLP
jgi:hypothetical protein